jgi:outer membrane protein assembly factor BamE (lipoprotein component of BamABCDE complex)
MNNKIFLLIVITLLSSCGVKDMEFEKSKWNERFDGFYEYRENMVQDLMENHLEKGMELKNVVKLLGEPGNYHNKEENEIIYEIMVDYGWNIDPMEGKELHIEFDKDSIVTNFRIEHWGK